MWWLPLPLIKMATVAILEGKVHPFHRKDFLHAHVLGSNIASVKKPSNRRSRTAPRF